MLDLLKILGWLGIVLGILSIVNITTGTLTNIWEKQENFSWNKMIKGISKVLIFYLSASAVAIAFALLPHINGMIINTFKVELLSNELLNTLSSVAVLGVVISTITNQGKKAIEGIIELANISTSITKDITFEKREEFKK